MPIISLALPIIVRRFCPFWYNHSQENAAPYLGWFTAVKTFSFYRHYLYIVCWSDDTNILLPTLLSTYSYPISSYLNDTPGSNMDVQFHKNLRQSKSTVMQDFKFMKETILFHFKLRRPVKTITEDIIKHKIWKLDDAYTVTIPSAQS